MKEALVDFSKFDENKIVADRDKILEVNPHRHELQLLDGILFIDDMFAVGFKDVSQDDFWVRGHFPERPLMPGVLMCECAAQLSAYFAVHNKFVNGRFVGLGGIDSVRFRGPVVPGDRLIVMLRKGKVRPNIMFTADFQGFVDQTLVVQGLIKGVGLGG